MKLRTRLFIGLGAVAIAFVLTALLIATTQRRYAIEQVDRQLRAATPLVANQLGDRPQPPPPDGAGLFSEVYIGHLSEDGTLTTVVRGTLVTGTPDLSVDDVTGDFEPFTVSGNGTDDDFRVLAARRPGAEGWDVIAMSLAATDAAFQRLLVATAIGALAVLSVIGLTAWWVVRLGVAPINAVTDAADAITSGERHRRLPNYPAGTEAAHLASAFNTMLDQKETADERLRQFVADASHELRTPLTSIRGYLELYHRGGLTEQGRLDDAMRRVSGEAERMGALVDDLLLLSKLDRGLPLDMSDVDLAALLDDAAADARAVQPARKVTVQCERPLRCTADALRIHQVVAALVANALVYTPPDTAIELRGERQQGAVVLSVVDHGPGLAPDVGDKVFERFFRGDESRARSTGGSGLGLSIARSIVLAHGGRIAVHSEPGSGCRFTIALPT